MKDKLKIDKKLTRSLLFERKNIDEESRTVTLSFSSEYPVDRYFGKEILLHSPDNVDLSRLNNKAAVLEDHSGRQIGVVEKAWIDAASKKGYADLRFSRNSQAEEVWQDIIDGIRSNVSFGYQVQKFIIEEEGENKEPVYRAAKWLPYEISIVSIPADPNVGIGRSLPEAECYEADIEYCEVRENGSEKHDKEPETAESAETPITVIIT